MILVRIHNNCISITISMSVLVLIIALQVLMSNSHILCVQVLFILAFLFFYLMAAQWSSVFRVWMQILPGSFLCGVCICSLMYSGSFPQTKDMQIGFRLIGDFKSTIFVNVRVNGCLFLYVGHMSTGIGSSSPATPRIRRIDNGWV